MTTKKVHQGFEQHPERVVLNNEVHSRPFVPVNSPARCTHIAMLHDTDVSINGEWEYIQQLCHHFGLSIAAEPSPHLIIDFKTFILKWERHTEFSSYTFIRGGMGSAPFQDTALAVIPQKWVDKMPGKMLVGVHLLITLCPRETSYDPDELLDVFGNLRIVGAGVSNNCATAWTDFRLHADGFSRILVKNISMTEQQTGRLLQRLWEIETYRMMSLLSMSLTRRVGDKTREIELDLADNVGKMINIYDPEQEHILLETLTRLAAQIENLSAETSFRFNASKAYYALVLKRVQDIKETSIDGIQQISGFIDRRLSPAMRTVESMDDRIAILSRRVSRASNLLQVRVNTTLQAQNKELLESMDRRAKVQLRLQQTVEGLSVVAISYYALGIVNILAKAGAQLWSGIDPTIVSAAFAPIIIGLVFLGIHRMRKSLSNGLNQR
ncbi:MAG: DUF3422 domain-containing protein [Emcibacter sp.]|nr:DUF3422 domain-containing protein [Emcibacter sp.]